MDNIVRLPEIPGYDFDEWLEDKGRLSRFGIKNTEDSVWVCRECERIADHCECDTDYYYDTDDYY